jgi:hypothetical protein
MRNTSLPQRRGYGCYSLLFFLFLLLVAYGLGWLHITPNTLHMKLPTQLNSLLKTDIGQSIANAAASGKSSTRVAKNGLSGAPSLSAAQMQAILTHAHSPVSSRFGQTLYDLGEQYHIDSAYALYWFDHESSFGKAGAAVSRHNFGNLICTPGYPSCDGRFRSYDSWEAGAEDWFTLMASSTYAGKSISEITSMYAPSSDGNDPATYAQLATETVARWRKGDVNP